VSAHLLAGFVLALVLAIADVAIGRVAPWIDHVSLWELVKAALSLAAMAAPAGLLFACSLSLLSGALRPLPWYERVRQVARQPMRWFSPDPPAFAWLVAVLTVMPVLGAFLWRAAFHFATGYHNPELSSVAMAFTSLSAFAAALVMVSALQPALTLLGRKLRGVASVGMVVVWALLALVAVGFRVFSARRDLLAVIDPRSLGLAASVIVAYPLVLVLLRSVLSSRRSRVIATLLACGTTVGGLAACALLYSQSHRVRAIVERETSFGIKLLHVYATLSDTDRDGYSFLFGGGDCDDGNRHVHPGAIEIPADGVDSNCMGGDTDPDVADLDVGRYAIVPNDLGRPNVLLITIDALRPDRLGAYNPKQRKVSPNIDAFARNAVRFDAAISPSSRSIRSIPAMFIGAYPSQIAFGPELLWPALDPQNLTAAEVLAQHGYQTAASIGTNYFSHMPGFFQGFASLTESRSYKPQRKEAATNAIAMLDAMQRKQKPWLMWVHLFNVHEPYLHDGALSQFGIDRYGSYDTEVALADQQVGRLLAWLKERGDPAHTVVMIASDHGEAFLEHGTVGHSYTLYNEELLSTLLVHVPGAAPRVVTTPVSLIDIAPTLLNLASVPMSRPLPSRSLLPLVFGQAGQSHRALYAELMPDGSLPSDEKALLVDGWKLIWWAREGSIQLFDLNHDPGERHDLSDAQRGRARQMHDQLRAWVTQTHLREHRRDEILARQRLSVMPSEFTARLDADYGPFTLVGYNLTSRDFRPGDQLALDLFFEVRQETRSDYFFEVTFKGPADFTVPRYLHAEHYPLNGGYRTYEWRAGELLRDPIKITIPQLPRDVMLDVRLRIIRRGVDRLTLETPATKAGWLSLGQIRVRH
jgi:arylsulfatase A-like enzyme